MSITFHYQIFVCFIAKVKYDRGLRTYRKETIQVFYKLRFIVLACSECLKRLRCRNFRKFLENGFLNFIPFWVRFCKQLGWYLPKICHVRFHRLFLKLFIKSLQFRCHLHERRHKNNFVNMRDSEICYLNNQPPCLSVCIQK